MTIPGNEETVAQRVARGNSSPSSHAMTGCQRNEPALRARGRFFLQTPNQPLLGGATLLRSLSSTGSPFLLGATEVQSAKKLKCASPEIEGAIRRRASVGTGEAR